MGIGINGSVGNSKQWWNYTNKEKPGYSTELIGYMKEMQYVPHTVFGKNVIERWDDGNPKRDLRMCVETDGEELWFQVSPGGRDKRASGGEDKRSEAMKALVAGLVAVKPNAQDIEECLGMRCKITTEEPPEGWSWGSGKARPWTFQFNANDVVDHRGFSITPDWEREGGEEDARPIEPAQVGTGNSKLDQAQAAAKAAVTRGESTVVNQWAQDEQPPTSVYDEDIPF